MNNEPEHSQTRQRSLLTFIVEWSANFLLNQIDYLFDIAHKNAAIS